MSITNFWKLKLFINHEAGQGFSESYNLVSANRTDAKADAKIICDNRCLLLGSRASIVHAAISFTDAARDSTLPDAYQVDPILLDAEIALEPVNRLHEGYQFDYMTADGRHTRHLFRGVRDPWIENMVPTVTPAAVTAPGAWVPVAPGLTAAVALGQFRSVIFYKTQHIRKIVGGYENTVYSEVSVPACAERQCGRGYSFSRGRGPAMV